MTELELLQKKFEEMRLDKEVLQILSGCNDMLQNGGNKNSVTEFLEMAIHFYGKDRIIKNIEKNNFKQLKKYIT